MAFNFLQNRVEKTIKKVQSKGTLTKDNITEVLSEIRLVLLESDVNLNVVNDFIAKVEEKALGEIVSSDRTSSQAILKIINEELIQVLGGETKELKLSKPATIMFVGLQGSGKTTSSAKVSNYLSKKSGFKKPLLVALDIYRPAAIDQLEKLANDSGFDFFADREEKNVAVIAEKAKAYAKEIDADLIILDTAGRLQTDEALMTELEQVKKITKPSEIIFVADAMSGQEIINVAEEFDNRLKLTATIISKLDSDAKGGAALSITSKLRIPIAFIGTGEKLDQLEVFHPDRMAGRLLGLGDIETLTEKAQEISDEKSQERMMRKMMSGNFDLDDLMESMQQMQKMGSLGGLMKMLPGMKVSEAQTEAAEKKMVYYSVLISSMTKDEKRKPNLLKLPKRKQRVLKGSGRSVQELNELLRQFERSQKQMKEVAKMLKSGKMPNMGNMGGGMPGMF